MPAFDAAAGHPHGEATRVMIAAVVCLCEAALRVNRAAEFATPDDERLVQQAALLQILNEPVTRTDRRLCTAPAAGPAIVMRIPIVDVHLHESHAALDQAGGPAQHCICKRSRLRGFVAVKLERAGVHRPGLSNPARFVACGKQVHTAECAS